MDLTTIHNVSHDSQYCTIHFTAPVCRCKPSIEGCHWPGGPPAARPGGPGSLRLAQAAPAGAATLTVAVTKPSGARQRPGALCLRESESLGPAAGPGLRGPGYHESLSRRAAWPAGGPGLRLAAPAKTIIMTVTVTSSRVAAAGMPGRSLPMTRSMALTVRDRTGPCRQWPLLRVTSTTSCLITGRG